jgi:hypothetical protein
LKKIKMTALAEELGLTFEQVQVLAEQKVARGRTGKGKNTWLSHEAAEEIRLATQVPLAVSNKLEVRAMRQAANPRFVHCRYDGCDTLIPVLIPQRLVGRMIGKTFTAESITDASNCTTYRYFNPAS